MATSFTNEAKNDATWTNEVETIPPAKADVAKADISRADMARAGEGQDWTNEDKNNASFTNETKN